MLIRDHRVVCHETGRATGMVVGRYAEETRESYVREAMVLAEEAALTGNRPFGAVIVDPRGAIVTRERNRVVELNDPVAHAEINAIRALCRSRKTSQIEGYSLYTNAAPCTMCFSASVNVRITTLGYGAPREPGTIPDVTIEELARKSHPQRLEIQPHLLREEAVDQLDRLTRGRP